MRPRNGFDFLIVTFNHKPVDLLNLLRYRFVVKLIWQTNMSQWFLVWHDVECTVVRIISLSRKWKLKINNVLPPTQTLIKWIKMDKKFYVNCVYFWNLDIVEKNGRNGHVTGRDLFYTLKYTECCIKFVYFEEIFW